MTTILSNTDESIGVVLSFDERKDKMTIMIVKSSIGLQCDADPCLLHV